MAGRRFKIDPITGAAAIWTGAEDTLPFTDPLAYADRVLFTTKFNYTRIIDRRTVNVTFPKANNGGERMGTITLFAHGRSGVPRVRGNITISGYKLSLGCHVPVQFLRPRTVSGGTTDWRQIFRVAIIGATSTNVVMAWYVNMTGSTDPEDDMPALTVPVTVEVTNEFN